MTGAVAYVLADGDGTPRIFGCARCGMLYDVRTYHGRVHQAKAAAEDCPHCRDRSEETRVDDCEAARRARIAKAKEVDDLDFCFSDDGGNAYATPEDAREAGERGVFGSTFKPYSVDAGQFIQNAIEDHHDDASENELVDLDKLIRAIEDFNEAQTGGSYEMDEKTWQRLRHDRTFAMIKPDATARGVEDAMLDDIRAAGFEIVKSKRLTLDRADAEWLYQEHAQKAHFRDLVDYTVSGEVVILLLQADDDDAPTRFRALMGPTDRTKAEPHTLRARYAVGYRENSIHGSDSPASAVDEIAHFTRSFD